MIALEDVRQAIAVLVKAPLSKGDSGQEADNGGRDESRDLHGVEI